LQKLLGGQYQHILDTLSPPNIGQKHIFTNNSNKNYTMSPWPLGSIFWCVGALNCLLW
jgi:hypothetical protein